ncbi:MAG: hypothetical protein ChlgKO_13590 [Chlamydiales bacterium]
MSVRTNTPWLARIWNQASESHCGSAYVTGKLLLPSQYIGPNVETSNSKMRVVLENFDGLLEVIMIPLDLKRELTTYFLWPEGWDRNDRSKCIIFNNPNGVTVPQFFQENGLAYTPGQLVDVVKCPIILYDYAGTGINGEVDTVDEPVSFQASATYSSVVNDGEAVLNFVVGMGFKDVTNWGSSLGGGVAAAATASFYEKREWTPLNVGVVNHDSFTTTPRVLAPWAGRIGDWFGSIVGGNLDAETPMRKLVEKGVKVLILCHNQDPVIPEGARIAEIFQEQTGMNAIVFCSPEYGHANLSLDMINQVEKILGPPNEDSSTS